MYARAGIPVEYLQRSWKDFDGDPNFKKLVRDTILSRIPDIYEQGQSYAFVGNLGIGKSYAACAILRLALVSDFKAKYETMSDIINTTLSHAVDSNLYLKELMEVDFLVIDEFDLRWVFPSEKAEKMFGSTLEHILRNRFQNKMPTILCSNTVEIDNVLSEDFSKAFESLRNQYIQLIYVSGKDYRKNGKLTR
jgi:DNA replication protein DnaC